MAMSLKLVALLVCFSTVSAINVLDQLVHPNSEKGMVAASTGPANGDSYNCDVPHLNAIQYGFNAALNISTDLTWKHADTLFNLIGNKLGESIESYVYVCEQRKNFYNGLGATYSDCTNSLFLFSQIVDPTATNFTQALLYSSIWHELDFMCNGGMEIGIQSYNDLRAVYSTDAYTQRLQHTLVVFYVLVANIMVKKVRPAFVLLSPYAFQNSKKVEFAAKHGALLFAIVFFFCLTACYFNTNNHHWAVFLPQVVFYSLTYIIGCNSDNRTFQLIQILITSILIPYSYGLTSFVNSTSLVLLLTLAYVLMSIYSFVLYVIHRKHYVKDLSTPQSVSRLNFVDFCTFVLLIVCIFSAIAFTEMVEFWFPLDTDPTRSVQKVSRAYYRLNWYILAGDFICQISLLVGLYIFVTCCNRFKSKAESSDVQIDCYGRTWYSVSHQLFLANSTIATCCSYISLIPYWFFGLTHLVRQNRSNVKPADAQEFGLKPLSEMTV
uniref:G_PROTEIN_RECEP_F1_2 domain-containing protein n=1 Tax=Panagrellus redivivus TaxID=6233 RepID=A0A7E4V830_PANRE